MIVTWSETYLRTSLTNAFNAIRSSPPSVSQYLQEHRPSPVFRRAAQLMPPSPTELSSIVNKTDHEREAAATTSSSTSSWRANLPDVRIYLAILDSIISLFSFFTIHSGLDPDCCSRYQYST